MPYARGKRVALLAVGALVLAACQPSDDEDGLPPCPPIEAARAAAPDRTGRISYISNGGGGGHCYGVFVMNADGTGARRVTKPPLTVHFYADWSQDGQLFAFDADCSSATHWDICVLNADGTGLRSVARGPNVVGPAFSPDGTRLAFARKGEGERQWDLYAVNIDGTGEQRVTNETGEAISPAWSPDGAWLAFTLYRGGEKQIFKVPSGGGRAVPLAPGGQINGAPAWSHDGRRIAFASDRSGKPPSAYQEGVRKTPGSEGIPVVGAQDIFVMDADGTNVTRITDNPWGNFLPAWSPDGRHLTFVSDRDGTYEVYVMNADGSGQVRLTRHAGDSSSPSWIS